MFAGEGDPVRTNRRFHLLAEGQPATRLSTAFDSVTLYGFDPAERPDIYGKVGNSGVSIATLDDMKELYAGFDLCDPTTSVSMTINGPAPDDPRDVPQHRDRPAARRFEPRARARPTRLRIRAGRCDVRGTVQADILKEDQGQNTCIFSTEFSLGMMADIAGVVHRSTRCATSTRCRSPATTSPRPARTPSASSRSPSPTASPTSRRTWPGAWTSTTSRRTCRSSSPTAWTPSTRCSAGSPAASGRSRCATATAPNERSQKLKYHVQTSGRSLHAQEMDFNDIRTTLQALCAIYDNANSLHTNAYDEAVTTPDRGVGAPGARHPADHQPASGACR